MNIATRDSVNIRYMQGQNPSDSINIPKYILLISHTVKNK
jgi:hypothetical protein